MNAKLTLTVDKEVIEKAKKFAKEEGRSLSNLIESYLRSLITESNQEFELSPIVSTLKGAVKIDTRKFDYGSILEEELIKKYLGDN